MYVEEAFFLGDVADSDLVLVKRIRCTEVEAEVRRFSKNNWKVTLITVEVFDIFDAGGTVWCVCHDPQIVPINNHHEL